MKKSKLENNLRKQSCPALPVVHDDNHVIITSITTTDYYSESELIYTSTKTKTEEDKMKNLSYRELEQKVIENRKTLRTTTDTELKRRLIAENHKLMTEMDSRWN